MKNIYLCFFITLISICKCQIYDIDPGDNTKNTFSFEILYNNNNIDIIEIKTDKSNQSYTPTCNILSTSLNLCSIQLNNYSQTEQYTFIDTLNPIPFKILGILNNKYDLSIVSIPKTSNTSILKFSGLYFQPYGSIFYLNITTKNLNNTKTFLSSKNEIVFYPLNPNIFEIDIGNSVGEIEFWIQQGIYNSGRIVTQYQNPTIESTSFDNNRFTINGDNFGNSQFSSYSLVKINSIVHDSSSFLDYLDNRIIVNPLINTNYSKSIQFDLSIANISTLTPFNFDLRGEVTILGFRLNCKRDDNSTSNIEISIGNKPCSMPENLIEKEFTSIKCLLPSGSENDENLSINITIDSIQNDQSQIKFSYHLPTISNYQHQIENDSLILIGNNFDDSLQSIHKTNISFNGNSISLSNLNNDIKNSKKLILSLSEIFQMKLMNGGIQVHTPFNKSSNSIEIKFKPSIQEIKGNINKNGGEITIIGRYLNLKRFNEQSTSMRIVNHLNSTICNNIKQIDNNNNNNNMITCNHSPTKSLNQNQLMIIIDDQQSNNDINVQFQPPIIHSVVSQSESTLIIIGENFGEDQSLIQIKLDESLLKSNQFTINEISFEYLQIELIDYNFSNIQTISLIINNQSTNSIYNSLFQSKSEENVNLSNGIIIAIVLCCCLFTIVLIFGTLFYFMRNKKK
ncbi:immunoglobulin E-set domain-containing protein [Tieghemostelium lacteum]|uniref:Immunoglobulin E-set domain-containing protein n=1 Tax=Tieghemostelium lacteum TaxID=361077 RepID=A0A151ZD39_TIELA|nr:immunoglobulin E-set domain-containing protein [Tieghemostelium lacteum]|eukprot:KYQ91794.1 immunoglobulin E-set domain-containing protein [Tieghemostelium lacteum]